MFFDEELKHESKSTIYKENNSKKKFGMKSAEAVSIKI